MVTDRLWQASAKMSWPTCPRARSNPEPHKHRTIWPCSPRGQSRRGAGEIKCSSRQSPWMREVSIGERDGANWNQHSWLDTQAGAFGSTSHAKISHPFAPACRQWGRHAGEWQGSHGCHRRRARAAFRVALHKDIGDEMRLRGSSQPPPAAWTPLVLRHSHLPGGCPEGDVNGGCCTKPCQLLRFPSNSGNTLAQGCTH